MFHLMSLGMGLILGSFFNVLIWRIPREESILWPASHCPNCGHKIRPWENIPVLSYALLAGKCRGCRQKISWVYPLIEILTALCSVALSFTLFLDTLASYSWFNVPVFLLQYVFLLMMVPMAIIDIRHYIIPDSFTIPFMAAGLLFSFIPQSITPLHSVAGILAGGGILYSIGWIGTKVLKKGEAMGFGDVKLMAAAGAIFGSKIALMGIVFGAFLGSIIGLTLIAFKKLDPDHHIPFGPFLGVGLWLAVLAGDYIVGAYLNFISRISLF